MAIETNGMALETDDQGYLVDPELWDVEVAEKLAEQYGMELTEDHWKVLKYVRDHYNEHHIAVDARWVIKYLAEDLGYGNKARARLYELFPYGYMQQACKIAGLRRPRAWSTG
ncbi:TusE/DsrC/DsvC family sulfur relay protein [Ectothiorhodospiraceae bacterium 2226]|nr:TusE/DsrC/DsvC family sulfur relay protein [Ectothiorhodospiraceae bacterium 2226]